MIDDEYDEPELDEEDLCDHEWSSGIDEDTDREIRIYCLKCGADGDA